MSLRLRNIGLVLIATLAFSAIGCSSPPWRKKPTVSQREKDAYFEQAASTIQYDQTPRSAYNYQAEPVVSGPAYTPNPPASQGGSCCH